MDKLKRYNDYVMYEEVYYVEEPEKVNALISKVKDFMTSNNIPL